MAVSVRTHGPAGRAADDTGTPGSGEPVARALRDLAAGRPVIVRETGVERESDATLVLAAEKASPTSLAFMIRHTSGFVCVALPGPDCDRLGLPPMVPAGRGSVPTGYTVTVDAITGVTTGISASERALTITALSDPATVPGDLVRPGHVVPCRAVDGGVLVRPGPAEAAVDLARAAGMRPAGAFAGIVSRRGHGDITGDELDELAATHAVTVVQVADLIAYRRRTERRVGRQAVVHLPTAHGAFRVIGYRGAGAEQLAFTVPDSGSGEHVPFSVHVECVLGDVISSPRCDCARELDTSLAAMQRLGRGVLIYLRPPAGERPLARALRAHTLADARVATPFVGDRHKRDLDEVDLDLVADILEDLGVRSTHPLRVRGNYVPPRGDAAV
jgi:3,4-dihydroxy 2-butanone 4-phosphate synthase/GTP cyclohydrolase II